MNTALSPPPTLSETAHAPAPSAERAYELELVRRLVRLRGQRRACRARLTQLSTMESETAVALERLLRSRAATGPYQQRHGHWVWGLRPTRPRIELVPGASAANAIAQLERLAPQYVRSPRAVARRRLLADRHRPELQTLLRAAGLQVSVAPELFVARVAPAKASALVSVHPSLHSTDLPSPS